MPDSIDTICAILTGKAADARQAQKAAEAAQACPYTAFFAARENTVLGVFCLPRSQQDWLEYPLQKPDFLQGLKDVTAVVTDQVKAASPWSIGQTQPDGEVTPCGRNCEECPHYRQRCQGCPATIFFLAAE